MDVPAALVGRSEQNIGVARIQVHFVESRVLRHVQHPPPGRSSVGGFVDSTLATAAPEGAVGCDPNDVGVFGMHRNHSNVF